MLLAALLVALLVIALLVIVTLLALIPEIAVLLRLLIFFAVLAWFKNPRRSRSAISCSSWTSAHLFSVRCSFRSRGIARHAQQTLSRRLFFFPLFGAVFVESVGAEAGAECRFRDHLFIAQGVPLEGIKNKCGLGFA